MKFINFSIVKFAFFLTVGILIAHFFQTTARFYSYFLLSFILFLFVTWIIARKKLVQNILFGIITYGCFFLLGILSYQVRLPEFQKNHYSHYISTTSENEIYQLKIKEILKPNTYNFKYIAEINTINNENTRGNILINYKKDSCNLFTIDDVILVSSILQKINTPLNPNQFDYSKYMKTLGVYNQIRITNQEIILLSKGKATLRGKAEKTRNHIFEKLKRSPLTIDELSIIQALILGQRKDISKEMYKDYADAGAIHILAVSGLHVGIVYFILLLLLSPLKSVSRGKTIQSVLIVISLWGFAFITGLSPSVVRAVTMFSFFAFAKLMNRETNSINTLFLSYFVLLLINPMWLFHVGFQLSYLAVFFILWVLPLFNKIYYPTNYFIKKIWGVLTVTIAAQIGIIPLSLFYFHQFPGLFFLTNLVILPFLGILLGGGIIIIFLALFNILPNIIATSYNYLILILNNFIKWIAHQEAFLIQDIHFTSEKVIGSYLLIIALIFLWNKINFQRTVFSLLCLALLIGVFILDDYKNSKNEMIVFHKSRQTLIGNKNINELFLLKRDSILNYKNSYPIKGYRVAQNISYYSEEKLPQIFSFNQKTILVIDSLGISPKHSGIDIVLLSLSPKVNLDRLIDNLQPHLIIADGNNYTSYVKRWKKTCEERNVPFHFTETDGAYIIE